MDKRTIPCTIRGDVPREDTAERLPLAVVLTCTACDLTYEPTAEAVASGRLGCPDPGCGGWTFSSALVEPTARPGYLSGGAA